MDPRLICILSTGSVIASDLPAHAPETFARIEETSAIAMGLRGITLLHIEKDAVRLRLETDDLAGAAASWSMHLGGPHISRMRRFVSDGSAGGRSRIAAHELVLLLEARSSVLKDARLDPPSFDVRGIVNSAIRDKRGLDFVVREIHSANSALNST